MRKLHEMGSEVKSTIALLDNNKKDDRNPIVDTTSSYLTRLL